MLLYDEYPNPSFFFYKIKIIHYRKAFELSPQQTFVNILYVLHRKKNKLIKTRAMRPKKKKKKEKIVL